MAHKVLYIVGVIYMPQPDKTDAPFSVCDLSLQLGDTAEECMDAAMKQSKEKYNREEYGFKWVGTTVKVVTPEEIERLNREAGTTAVMLWPDTLPNSD